MQTIVTFSGAGLSAESGIPTFRDSNGLWYNHKVEDVASQEGWVRDPQLVLNFYAQRFDNIRSCQPNAGHKALARLHEKYDVIHITQNIDDLLERAGCQNVWHLHGSILQRRCERHKLSSMLEGDLNFTCDYIAEHDRPVSMGDLCPKCGAQCRPAVVWFGEAVDMRHRELLPLIRRTDIFICVGTSAQVSPASDLLWMFRMAPAKFFIDPNPPLRLQSYNRIVGTAGERLPRLVEAILLHGSTATLE